VGVGWQAAGGFGLFCCNRRTTWWPTRRSSTGCARWGPKPEKNPPLGAQPDWARTDMMETARKEIDNTVRLKELLESTPEPMLDTRPPPEEETDHAARSQSACAASPIRSTR